MIDVDETLRAVSADIASRLEAAAEQAAETVVRAYVAGGHVKSWEMAKNVYYVVDPEQLRFKIVSPVFYSAFLEFGTKHQPARYPVQNAMLANMENTIRILEGNRGGGE